MRDFLDAGFGAIAQGLLFFWLILFFYIVSVVGYLWGYVGFLKADIVMLFPLDHTIIVSKPIAIMGLILIVTQFASLFVEGVMGGLRHPIFGTIIMGLLILSPIVGFINGVQEKQEVPANRFVYLSEPGNSSVEHKYKLKGFWDNMVLYQDAEGTIVYAEKNKVVITDK